MNNDNFRHLTADEVFVLGGADTARDTGVELLAQGKSSDTAHLCSSAIVATDYATFAEQAALREEGFRVILVNSNPATIMTDPVMADNIYLLPLTPASIESILQKHDIDAVLPTMGGQTALNLCIEADKQGLWEENNVKIIGVDIDAINITEDREEFRLLMEKIGIGMAPASTATSYLKGKEVAQEFGYPLCVRASYTLGGSGVAYWPVIAKTYGLDIEVVNDRVDPTFSFMTLDKDGKIRMDCSSPYAMAGLIKLKDKYIHLSKNDKDDVFI